MFGFCKLHKDIVDNCLPFRPILSAIKTPANKLAKFLVPILKPLTSKENIVNDLFAFAEDIVEQDSNFFMGSEMLILFLQASQLKRPLTFALIHFLKILKE